MGRYLRPSPFFNQERQAMGQPTKSQYQLSKFITGACLAYAGYSAVNAAVDLQSWEQRPLTNFVVMAGFALASRKLADNFSLHERSIQYPASFGGSYYKYNLLSERNMAVAGLFAVHALDNLAATPEAKLGAAALHSTVAAGMLGLSAHVRHKLNLGNA
jgi:hypothetical protein